MTDLATKPSGREPDDEAGVADGSAAPLAPGGAGPDAPAYEWAPIEPEPKKRRTGMWIGIGAGAVVVALVATSVILIAPGTTVGGVPVGGMTEGAAADAISQAFGETTVVLAGEGGDAEVTAADLGATIDASGLASQAYTEHPMWNVGAWFADIPAGTVELDTEQATAALRDAAPGLYTDPVDATLAFDAATASYVVTPAVEGAGVDVAAVQEALQEAFEAGQSTVELDTTLAPVDATTPTFVADATAATLNGILDQAGFYVGAERTVPVARDVVASWLTITPGDRGTFDIAADPAKIQATVDGLAPLVNRPVQNGTVITNSAGEVLLEETAGVAGRELGDVSGVADAFATQLAGGNGAFELPVSEVAPVMTTLARRIEVNLSSQTTTLFENGQVVNSYAISSGLPGWETPTGNFTVFAHVRIQDMGCVPGVDWCTRDVPWVTYFAPDVGFHGTYWHDNFGTPMSHGCVNMPVGIAEYVYNWAPEGTEVSVFY